MKVKLELDLQKNEMSMIRWSVSVIWQLQSKNCHSSQNPISFNDDDDDEDL